MPQDLANALVKGLEKTPSARYASMDQFAKVLRVHTIPVSGSATNLEALAVPSVRPIEPIAAETSLSPSHGGRAQDLHARNRGKHRRATKRKLKLPWPVLAGISGTGVRRGSRLCASSFCGTTILKLPNPPRQMSEPTQRLLLKWVDLLPHLPTTGESTTRTTPLIAPAATVTKVRPNPFVAQWVADDYEIGHKMGGSSASPRRGTEQFPVRHRERV